MDGDNTLIELAEVAENLARDARVLLLCFQLLGHKKRPPTPRLAAVKEGTGQGSVVGVTLEEHHAGRHICSCSTALADLRTRGLGGLGEKVLANHESQALGGIVGTGYGVETCEQWEVAPEPIAAPPVCAA